ncbi:MAG: right-handed parallel beta-helix repeat-containing protein [Thermoguttaceae bacterium]
MVGFRSGRRHDGSPGCAEQSGKTRGRRSHGPSLDRHADPVATRQEIVFEKGCVVQARRGAFLGTSDCLFVAGACRNLVLRGEGATLRMHKADYHKPPYRPAEWRHTLSLRGCENVTVEGLTLADSGGDGIYLGAGATGASNRNIVIRNVVCDGHNRQGISIITAENLLIENCVFSNTGGTAPEAGIDFEPNDPRERLVNCVLRNCRSENNAGHAYLLYLGQMRQDSPPVSIRFENCTSKQCRGYSAYLGVANRNGEPTVRGSIDFVDCRFEADLGAAVSIRGNEADGCRLRLERCEIVRRDPPDSRIAPITIAAPQRLDLDAGNVEIVDCTIRDSLDRPPLALSASPMTALRNVSGSLTVESPRGKTAYTLDAEQLARWFPAQGLVARIPRLPFDWRMARPAAAKAASPKEPATFRLRREAALLVWGQAGRPVELAVTMEPVGRAEPRPDPIEVASPGGPVARLEPKGDSAQAVYAFTPGESGVYRLHWLGDGNETLRPLRCTAPLAILGEMVGANFIRPIGTLYFAVPAGVSRWAIVVGGSGEGETVKATVRNAAGDLVAEQDNIAAPHAFVLERGNAGSAETWSLVLDKAAQGVLEDVSLQAVGVPPVFATTPGDLLVPGAAP